MSTTRPVVRPRIGLAWLAAAALVSLALWQIVERATVPPIDPRYAEMVAAARTMQAAASVLAAEKAKRGLLAAVGDDPNRTGMIGAEYTPITTTLGDLVAKRTATNPDLAAAFVKLIGNAGLPAGSPALVIVSGSFVGANIAALVALEALGHRPVVVASLGASMWGANNPEFNWLDMVAVLRSQGVIRSAVTAAVLGGDGGVAGGLDPAAVAVLRATAARQGVRLVEMRPFSALIDALLVDVKSALGDGVRPSIVINVGGALIGLGNCRESFDLAPGLTGRKIPCTDGTPGLAMRAQEEGVPLLHVLNLKRMAVELGLPVDPVPLPMPGNNKAVYGSGRIGGQEKARGGLMVFGLDPWILFAVAVGLFIALHIALRWPLPLAFIAVAVVVAVLGDYVFVAQSTLSPGIAEGAFRHLVEGSFGFLNLVLALFAGTFFGHMVRMSGAADAAAAGAVRLANGRVLPVLVLAAIPIFAVGMFVGLSGVAVLSAGVFAVPALRKVGYGDATIAAFIAVLATAGMIAPPVNVPAMHLSDGVNMPWTNVARALLALAVPLALFALAWFRWGQARPNAPAPAGPPIAWSAALAGIAPFAVMIAIWLAVRLFPFAIVDPSSPAVLIVGGLAALPMMRKGEFRKVIDATFTGTPLILAAVLIAVGILIQVMTLTGVRGWLVISVMSLPAAWLYGGFLIGMPLLGGALTSMSVADVLGVPVAFSFVGQQMILNVAALSAIASLAEFIPPTSIAAALACYVVGGGTTVGQVFRRSWPPMLFVAILATLMLVFAKSIAGWLT